MSIKSVEFKHVGSARCVKCNMVVELVETVNSGLFIYRCPNNHVMYSPSKISYSADELAEYLELQYSKIVSVIDRVKDEINKRVKNISVGGVYG
ncbi:MAG: hypothetical protein QXV17_06905 [Candidatus Micrarchaeaceae archaeon]